MELNENSSMKDTLQRAQTDKKHVEVFLRGGHCFRGVVSGIGEQHVIIGRLQGQEFFDAQVRLDHISAISLQTRGE